MTAPWNRPRPIESIGVGIILGFFILIILFPFYWLLVTSVRPAQEIFMAPPTLWPLHLEWARYMEIWNFIPMFRYFLNSLLITGSTIILALILTSTSAYSLSRFEMKGKNLVIGLLLFSQLVPGVVTIVPAYFLLRSLGFVNTYHGLIISYATFSIPFATLLLRGYFKNAFPKEVEESALIDGCTYFQAFYRIAIPIARPGMIAVGTFIAIQAWNEYLWASVLVTRNEMRTLPVGLRETIGEFGFEYIGEFATASVYMFIPIMAAFLFAQRQLKSGLASGALKG